MIRLRSLSFVSPAAVFCLAVGLGASAISFAMADAVVLRPFGLAAADQLVVLWEADPARPADISEISLPTFEDWEREASAFSSIAAFGSSHWPGIARLNGESFSIAPRAVSRAFFRTLGQTPALGRDFASDDRSAAKPPPVVLSHDIWTARFGGARDVIGRSFFIDNQEHLIVGVMPKGFAFPDAPDVWISVERVLDRAFTEDGLTAPQRRAIGVLMAVGRLTPCATHEEARRQLNHILLGIQREFFPNQPPFVAVVTPFTEIVLGRLGARVWIALGMTLAILLFACANVAGLRMADWRSRLGELSARLCLGASRAQLTRLLVGETVPLIALSAAAAVVIALGLEAWLHNVPVVAASGIDLTQSRGVTGTAIILGAVTAWVLVSIAPAVSVARRVSPADVTLGARSIIRGSRGAGAVLLVQAAVALCLVSMAAGAFRAFARLAATDVGFSTSDVTVADVSVPGWKYESPQERARLDHALVEALSRMPGAHGAVGVSVRPFRFGEIADGMRVRRPEDVTRQPNAAVAASRVIVTPQYFDAMGIRLREGRAFRAADAEAATGRVLVSESLARGVWGDRPALGQELEFFTLSRGWQRAEVVGVAEDVRSRLIDRPAVELYVPHGTGGIPLGSFVVRHATDRPVTELMLRTALQSVDPDVVLERVQTTRAVVERVLAPSKLLSTAMTMLGATGVILLALGIFGAAATALRIARREVAIRQAIGATPFRAARAPLRSLLAALAIGTCAGAAIAPAGVGLLATIGVAERGSLVIPIALAAAAVVSASAAAILINVRRAAVASPAELLRAE